MMIRYADEITFGPSAAAKRGFVGLLKRLIVKNGFKRILEVGGGANPVLSLEYILATDLQYTVLDLSHDELQKAPAHYEKAVQDIAAKEFNPFDEFDFVFSKMVAEHVRDAAQMHINIHALLRNGGMAAHIFSTLYALPFVANKVLPEKLTRLLLELFAPRDEYQHAKFPAYYSWCTGPTAASLRRLRNLGYEIVEYKGLFGHEGYYRRISPLLKLHRFMAQILLRHPNPYLTSYAIVVLRKKRPLSGEIGDPPSP